VDGHQGVELGLGQLRQRRVDAHARVVDQGLQTPATPLGLQRRLDLGGKARELAGLAHVQGQGHQAPAQGFHLLPQGVGLVGPLTVGDDQIPAALGQRQGHAAAQAAAGAGDQGDRSDREVERSDMVISRSAVTMASAY
jgi:hypothetical protein